MAKATPGYSGTPLAKKLGICANASICLVEAPADYKTWLEPLPEGVKFTKRESKSSDLVHCFVTDRAELEKLLTRLRRSLRDDAAVWVSWPKKSSKVPTDITEDVIREVALPLGFVDIKVCAVTEVWSGLKVVVRKELRGS